MYIDQNGNKWFKGNLHTHTTISDGRKSPEEVLALYREHGYDFIALTDHYKYGQGGLDEKTGILVLPGCEYHTGANVREGIYHIVSIACDEEPALDRTNGLPPAQTIIDEIKAKNGVAILAHPAWSLDEPAEILKLHGLDATEIYNTVSGRPWNVRPYSGLIIDRVLASGMDLGLVAADDSHFYNGEACRSYVLVKAEECTIPAIRRALLAGDYKATQKPFLTVVREEDTVTARTDYEMAEFTFFTDVVYSGGRCFDNTSEAVYHFKRGDTVVRCEVRDHDGNCAWSNPIRL